MLIRLLSPLVRLFLKLILLRKSKFFHQSLTKPKESQDKTFRRILNLYNSSSYSKNFSKIKDYEGYKNIVPIIDYDDIAHHILSMKKTGTNYFSPGPVLFYEPTSGSSGAKKLIPYTWSLKSSFTRMFCLWAYDLIKNGPTFSRGKFYFSVSPQFKEENEGLSDDSEYLEGFFSWFLKPFFVTPKKIKKIRDPNAFKKILSLHLLAEVDLEIISIWSPSTFTVLLEYIQENMKELILILERGSYQAEGITFHFKKINQARVRALKSEKCSQYWPHLKLISAWGSQEASMGFEKLKRLFPTVLIQAKGLLATEAPITIPLIKSKSFAPLLDDIFFEFISDKGELKRLHELKGGETYKLIISTPGGLYRYTLGDKVEVQDFVYETPCLSFVGRGEDTSDLFGEKINSKFLKLVLEKLDQNKFYSFSPNRINDDHGNYFLLTDDASSELEEKVEDYLLEAYHYKVARKLGNLRPLKVIFDAKMNEKVLSYFQVQKGLKLGDIKPQILIKNIDIEFFKDIS